MQSTLSETLRKIKQSRFVQLVVPRLTEDDSDPGTETGSTVIDDIHIGGEETTTAYDGFGEITDLYQRLDEVVDDIEQRKSVNGAIKLKPDERSHLLEFYVVGHAHLERISAIILYEAIGDKDQKPWNTINFFREFSQQEREGLLYRLGVIDEGMKGEMKNIRSMRNDLVHNQVDRMHLPADEHLGTKINRAFSKLQELDKRLDDPENITITS